MRNLQVLALCLPLVLSAASSQAQVPRVPGTFSGRVAAVEDGDSIIVLYHSGSKLTQVRVYLQGIDAPEIRQVYGQQARAALSRMVFRQVVQVRATSRNRNGVVTGWVSAPRPGGMFRVNHTLVRAGWAWWARQHTPQEHQLGAYQMEAGRARRGLWAATTRPIAPWDWRRIGR
jgi:endonuclease YncB( thermonuclease family)